MKLRVDELPKYNYDELSWNQSWKSDSRTISQKTYIYT